MNNNKGNLELISAGMIVLVLGGIILTFGLIILDELQTSTTAIAQTTNESSVATNTTNTITFPSGVCGFHDFSIFYAINGTGLVLHSGTNYTVLDAVAGTWKLVNLSTQPINISYTYYSGDNAACRAANTTIGGTGKLADYWELIVLAIVVAVVISILLIVFAGRQVE